MTWIDPKFQSIIDEGKQLVQEFLSCELSAIVLFCSRKEMSQVLIKEFEHKLINELEREVFLYELEFIEGRYFKEKNEIWLVDQYGNNLETLIHEYLHSIQTCSPRRENIVKFLTYRLTESSSGIESKVLTEWLEIEKQEGLESIKKRLKTEGDCEEFWN